MAETYRQVGKEHGLTGKILDTFVEYMNGRWEDSENSKVASGYAGEWAERFKRGDEYLRSDLEGRKLLDRIHSGF